jgi:hypothetical protein
MTATLMAMLGAARAAGGGGGGSGPALLRGTATTSNGAVPHATVKPTGVVSGDVLYAFQYAGSAPAVLSGFTGFGNGTDWSGSVYQFSSKVAGGSEPSTYAFTTVSGSGGMDVILWAYSNNDNTTPAEGFSASGSTATTAFTAPSVTASLANSIWITIFGDTNSTSNTPATPPSGATLIGSKVSGSIGALYVYAKAVGTGATGTAAFTWNANAWGTKGSFIVRSATP